MTTKIQKVGKFIALFDEDNKVIKSEEFKTTHVFAEARLRKFAKENNMEVK